MTSHIEVPKRKGYSSQVPGGRLSDSLPHQLSGGLDLALQQPSGLAAAPGKPASCLMEDSPGCGDAEHFAEASRDPTWSRSRK